MSRRAELIKLCAQEPEKVVDLLLSLEARIEALEKQAKKNSKNSDQPPSSDGLKKPKRRQPKSNRKQGGKPGHKGKTRKFSDNPDQILEHSPAQCPGCGHNLDEVSGTVLSRRQEIEIPARPVEVIEHRRLQKVCPGCGQTNAGQWPLHLKGNVQYGHRFKALCVYLMSYQLLPYERTSELLATLFGYQLGGGTLQRFLSQAYQSLEPIEQRLKTVIRGSPVAHADETGIRVDGQTKWLHVFSTQHCTYYYWSDHRGQKAHHADGLLPSYQGIVMHDAYRSYFVHKYQHALCNAHLLRELQAIYEVNPKQRWPLHLMRLLRLAWALVKQAHHDGLAQLSISLCHRIRSLFDNIIQAADKLNPHNLRQPGQRGRIAQSDTRNLLDRLIQFRDAYLRFVSDFRVPFDNNLAERDLRMAKLQQKISGCFRTALGASRFCRIRAYISTLRKQQLQLLHSLVSLWNGSPFFPYSAE